MINVALFGLMASLVLSPTMHDVKGEIALNRAYTSTMIVTNITDLEDYCNIRNLGVKEIRSMLDFMSDLETDEQEFEINGEMWTVKKSAQS